MGRKLLKTLTRPLQIVFSLALIVYLTRYVVLRWQDVSDVGLSFDFLPILCASALLILFYLIYSLTWIRLLRWIKDLSNGTDLSAIMLLRIFFVAFIARYLPAGTLWTVSGKIELLKREGLRRAIGLTSVLFEQVYLASGTILLASAAFLFYPLEGLPAFVIPYRTPLSIAGMAFCLLTLIVPDWILRISSRFLHKPILESTSSELTPSRRTGAFIRLAAANLAQGLAGMLVLTAIYPAWSDRPDLIPVVISAYPFSRLIGQIFAFVPGGIGVREGSFILVLGPLLPVESLLAAAASMRLISVFIELIMLGSILLLDRSRVNHTPDMGYNNENLNK
jgi:uncharacterized membrane protein YbhN (UPF0104 family)